MAGKKLVLLNGSVRKRNTSYSFARTIKQLAESGGHSAEILNVIDYFSDKEKLKDLTNKLDESDIAGLVTPMYVDWLPYIVAWLFERLAADNTDALHGKYFFAVAQCGFLDIDLLRPSLESCRFFARSTGMKWLGGLAYPGGAAINGALMEDLGKRGEAITSGFRLALDEIVLGKQIRAAAQDMITMKVPRFIYRPLTWYFNYLSKKKARKQGVTDLSREYYLEDQSRQ